MTYKWTAEFGGGVILAPCLQQLCKEIAASPKYSKLTNLGEIGDSRHKGQGTSSDHNPFVVHDGKGYVRAVDLGGDRALLLELRDELHKLYVAKDKRVYPFGYFKGPDSKINDWFGTGWHTDTGDEGHLHISVTQKDGYHPSSGGYVAALDSRAAWGIGKPAAVAKPFTIESPFPYWKKPGHVVGEKSSPSAKVHGGIDATEKRYVRAVAVALHGISGYNGPALSSGEFGPGMRDAVAAFQKKQHRKVTGTVGLGTWRALRKAWRAKKGN